MALTLLGLRVLVPCTCTTTVVRAQKGETEGYLLLEGENSREQFGGSGLPESRTRLDTYRNSVFALFNKRLPAAAVTERQDSCLQSQVGRRRGDHQELSLIHI